MHKSQDWSSHSYHFKVKWMTQGLLPCSCKSTSELITDCVNTSNISTPFQINQITVESSMWEARSASSHLRLVTWLHKCSSSIPGYSNVGKIILATGLRSWMYSSTGLGWSWQPRLLPCHIPGGTSASVCLLPAKRGTEAGIPQIRWYVSARSPLGLCEEMNNSA